MKTSYLFFILFFPFCLAAQQKKNSGFSLDCDLKGDLSGYIYLQYEDKLDSCLITNHHFSFKGNISRQIEGASLSLKYRPSAQDKTIYLENSKMKAEVSATEKTMPNGTILTRFNLGKISGSHTDEIQEGYLAFEEENKLDENFSQKALSRLNDIVSQNPNNPYSGDLLSGFSRNDKYDKEELKKIYSKLDQESQDEFSIKFIEKNLFPERHIDVNDMVYNFQLPDRNNHYFNTESLKGKWYLIDFWASWCGPCRAQLPGLKNLYGKFRNKNFEIIGVSIDKNKKDWISALDKENLNWYNTNENKHFYGSIVKKYNVSGVPSNFLINPEGKIVAKNLSVEELEKKLNERN